MAQSLGAMVNYRYDLDKINQHHEAFATKGTVASSAAVRALLKQAQQLPAPVEK